MDNLQERVPGATGGVEPAFLDILDPAFQVDSPQVKAAAEACWYARTPLGILALRYAECSALLKDRRLRQGSAEALAEAGIGDGPFIEWLASSLLSLEGEQHLRLRRLVSTAFNQRSIERLRPFMRDTAHRLIDAFAGAGECEFMAAFADLYPAWVIAELLGVPAVDFEDFLGYATDIGLGFGFAVGENKERVEAALAGLQRVCDDLVDRRRHTPGDDLISALLVAEAEGGRLSAAELRNMVPLLVFAGQDTTRNQLGLAMATFAEHPEQWALLRARPELATSAVEEIMRISPAVPATGRIAVQDFTFQDLEIPAGTHVGLFAAAGNADPAIFGDVPFDITADRPAQLTFGGGVHYCLGAGLARAEMCEALPILATRLGDYTVAGPVPSRPQVGITGPVALPLRFALAAVGGQAAG
jgi:cytochrome P450